MVQMAASTHITVTVAEMARLLSGEVQGDATATLNGFAMIDRARPGDLTFAETPEYFAAAEQSQATAIIADARFSSAVKTVIRVANARVAFAKALAYFFPEPPHPAGIHPSAVIAASAVIDPTAHIGSPGLGKLHSLGTSYVRCQRRRLVEGPARPGRPC